MFICTGRQLRRHKMTQQWFLGVDGGGSTTRALLRSADGQMLGPFQGPGSNPFDHPAWQQTLTDLIAQLPVWSEDIASYCIGLAGHGDLADVSSAQEDLILRVLPNRPGIIVNDAQIAHDGAFLGAAGVLLLAGTGSAAWASDGAGRYWRVGGQGEAYGDEGSAHWIGRQALSLLVRSLEQRRPDPAFTEPLLTQLGLQHATASTVLAWTYATNHLRSRIASVAQCVDILAQTGQPTAVALLEDAAHLLAELVQAAWTAWLPDLPQRWSSAGSVTSSTCIHTTLIKKLSAETYRPPRLTPVEGAVWRAQQLVDPVIQLASSRGDC